MPSSFINQELNIQTQTVGAEQTTVLTCDDFLRDMNGLLEEVHEKVSFEKEKTTYYPGYRAPLPRVYTLNVLNAVLHELIQAFGIPVQKKVRLSAAFFSFVARPERDLTISQRIPHFDNTHTLGFAIMHYLNPGDFGGTGFFRHRQTGFERIGDDRKSAYFESLQTQFNKNEPAREYIKASNNEFELISTVGYLQNRMIIYPSNILHSGLIQPDRDLHSKSDKARLTANIFIEFV